jgi:hypothetical protein
MAQAVIRQLCPRACRIMVSFCFRVVVISKFPPFFSHFSPRLNPNHEYYYYGFAIKSF